MSRYIGKRVFYHCGECKKPFTLNKKSVDVLETLNAVFCSKECYNKFLRHSDSSSVVFINGIPYPKNV